MDFQIIFDFILKLFIVGVIPFYFLPKQKSFYLEYQNFDIPIVFNYLASLVGVGILICYFFRDPINILGLYDVTKCLFIAILSGFFYFLILFLNKKFVKESSLKELEYEIEKKENALEDKLQKVGNCFTTSTLYEDLQEQIRSEREELEALKNQKFGLRLIVTSHLILYLLIFCFLSIAFVKSKLYYDYVLVEGKVQSLSDGHEVKNARLSLFHNRDSVSYYETSSDEFGVFSVLIPRNHPTLDSIAVTAKGFKTFSETGINETKSSIIENIVLEKE